MEGFLDLNCSPNYPLEHFEESLKQTMLDHDIIFKKQVHDFHGLKSDSKYYTRRETFPMKTTFKDKHSVGSTQFLIDSLFSQDDDDDDDLNLSLSIGRNINKKRKSWKNKIVNPSSQEIIDLEEYSGIGSSENVQRVISLDQSSQKSMDHIKQYPSHGMIESLVNGVDLYKDPLKVGPRESLMNGAMHSSDQGSHECHDVKQTKLMDFDLNKDLSDESSFQSNEPSSDLTEEKETNISKLIEEKKKEDSDYAIQKAANSLISISLQQASTSNQDSESKSGSNETENNSEKKNEKRRQRSSSIDSYESLVLKLEESSVDEDCVTSMAFEITEIGKIENGIKLRRGRRLKDFQKDILPTLSSLSRHEIWEDIKILEGVIRSREYKRLQKSKAGNVENWFTPVKNKRSKVNDVGQRKKR